MLISNKTINNINELIQIFFQLNRTWDNFLGFSNVEWALHNFNNVFHHGLAHLYPLLADKCSDILLMYNIVPEYRTTNADLRTYDDIDEFFVINIEEHKNVYELLKKTKQDAHDNEDINVEVEIDKLLRMFNKFIEQAILLKDKAETYGDTLWAFDAYAQQFYILEEIKEELVND